MSSGNQTRDRILAKVRSAVGPIGDDSSRRFAVQKRLSTHESNPIPARAREGAASIEARFVETLEGQGASVRELQTPQDVPQAVADYLRERNLPSRIRFGTSPWLNDLDWTKVPALERTNGPAHVTDAASLTKAIGAAGETGTLFLVSGAETPTSLNFLPEHEIIVIERKDIAGAYEDVWNRIRSTYGDRNMPRAVNMVSGPSRTADIEQTIVQGAHGPRALHILIVG